MRVHKGLQESLEKSVPVIPDTPLWNNKQY